MEAGGGREEQRTTSPQGVKGAVCRIESQIVERTWQKWNMIFNKCIIP